MAKYDAAMDKLDRLRCLSRATISSCAGSEDAFLGNVAHYYTPMGDRCTQKWPGNAHATLMQESGGESA